ncbi:MAG: hypothetical protein WBH97_06825 [Rectinemataceae bacterium]
MDFPGRFRAFLPRAGFAAFIAFAALTGIAGVDSALATDLDGGAGAAQKAAAKIAPGLWTGTVTLKRADSEPGTADLVYGMTLRLLEGDGGALADIPEQSMYGYPLDSVSYSATRVGFVLSAMGPGQELKFDGLLTAKSIGKAPAILGTVRGTTWKGSFMLAAAPASSYPGEKKFSFSVEGGNLPGTLLVPPGKVGGIPVVVLLSGAGAADRDGNNFNVPGRNDALLRLARALADRGVASFRFDKRGTGEAYRMTGDESTLPYGTHIRDAAAAIAAVQALPGWSRVLVAGMNEGAWIGAAALNGLAGAEAWADGLAVIAASGKSPVSLVRESFATLPPDLAAEAENILVKLIEGEEYPEPSPTLADFFDPARKARLSSWLGFDPSLELAAVPAPLLMVFGDRDLQAPASEFDLLLEARPNAAAFVIPGMNHALKLVGDDEEANYASFSDPEYPVPDSLADLLAGFALVRPAPAGLPRYERNPR